MSTFRESIRETLYGVLEKKGRKHRNKTTPKSDRPAPGNGTFNTLDYKGSVDAGKDKEAKIINALRKQGVNIKEPTKKEDMYDKIDGWLVGDNGTRPVQIKYRQTGDDIIFEIMKDFDNDIEGRDMKSKAELYLVVDTKGTARLIPVAEIKRQAKLMEKFAKEKNKVNPRETKWNSKTAELKITTDRRDGQRKLMAYFYPSQLPVEKTWKIKI